MHIEDFKKAVSGVSPKGFEVLATFTLVLERGLKLFEVKLIKGPKDEYLVFPPDRRFGGAAWFMPPEMRSEVLRMALTEMDKAALERFAKLAKLAK